jgi:RHS repeat-associated protein
VNSSSFGNSRPGTAFRIASYTYGYDPGSRLTSQADHGAVATYTYDKLDQLITDSHWNPNTLTYDPAGNRSGTGNTIATGNRLTASFGATYTYDDEGNRSARTDTSSGQVTTYAYDHRNRLTGVTVKSAGGAVLSQATYTYDALDRRIAVTLDTDGVGLNPPLTTWTAHDADEPYADFAGAGGALQQRYLHGPAVDELLARTGPAASPVWYLTDRLGSVIDAVKTNGTPLYSQYFTAFGASQGTVGTGSDRFGFTGRETDPVSGLQYNRARYYDAAIARWTQEDPIAFAGGDSNLYRYVGNSPTNATDPYGLSGGGLSDYVTQAADAAYRAAASAADYAYQTGREAAHTAYYVPGEVGRTFQSGEAFDSVLGYQAGLWDHSVAPVGDLLGWDWNSTARPYFGHEAAFRLGHRGGDATGYVMDAASLGYGAAGRGAIRLTTMPARLPALVAPGVGLVRVAGSGAVVAVPAGRLAGMAGGANAVYNLAKDRSDGGTVGVHGPKGITTPSAKLQQWAQQGGYIDPRTNKFVSTAENLAADHVYPKSLIKRLPGFDRLSAAQQEWLLNYPGNFEPLPKSWNSSKLNRLADDWAKTPMGRQASKEYIDALRQRQQAFEGFAKNMIDFWLGQ